MIKPPSLFVNSNDNASFESRNIQRQIKTILHAISFQAWNLEAQNRMLFEDNLTVSVDIKIPG